MSEISGKVFIHNAEIQAHDELHLKDGAKLRRCIIYCDVLVQHDGDNASLCLVHSKAGVGACYDREKPEEGAKATR